MEKNYELELYKLIIIPDEDDRDILYVNKFGWVNNNEFCIWVNISIIDDFIEKLKDIFGYSFLMMVVLKLVLVVMTFASL